MNYYTPPTKCQQCGHTHHKGMPITYQGQELTLTYDNQFEYTEGYMQAQCENCNHKQILPKP